MERSDPQTDISLQVEEKGDTAIRREIRLIRDTRLARSSDNPRKQKKKTCRSKKKMKKSVCLRKKGKSSVFVVVRVQSRSKGRQYRADASAVKGE